MDKLKDNEIKTKYNKKNGKFDEACRYGLKDIWRTFKEIVTKTTEDICGATKRVYGGTKTLRK